MAESPVALVTGAAGFAGRHLLAELERETDWDVVGLTRRQADFSGRGRSIAVDLRNAELVERVVGRYRPDFIFHLAAQSYVPKSIADPAGTFTNNVVSQINLLETCRRLDLKPAILIVGSSEEYGHVDWDELPIDEEQPLRPGNPYAVSKVAQDMLGFQYATSHGLHIVRVRPFNHFGPGQSDRFVVASFARQIAEAEVRPIEPTILTGNLDVERDFTDVRDIVRAYRIAVMFGEAGAVYNLASGRALKISDLLNGLIGLSTISLDTRVDPSRFRPAETPVIIGDFSRFHALCGWQPELELDASLEATLQYWRARTRAGTPRD